MFLATMMVPFEVVFFTNLQTSSPWAMPLSGFLGLDTYGALAVPFLATGFGAFLVRQAFLSLPARPARRGRARRLRALAVHVAGRGAARPADDRGAGAVLVLRRVEPVPVAAGRHRRHYRTVQVGLRQLSRVSLDQINVTFAGTVLAALPLLILLLMFQKQLVRGLTAGAVKG